MEALTRFILPQPSEKGMEANAGPYVLQDRQGGFHPVTSASIEFEYDGIIVSKQQLLPNIISI